MWSELDHPSCLKFFGVSLEPAEYLMICEHMDGGTLAEAHERKRAAKLPPPTLPELVARLKLIASAMAYLHSRAHLTHTPARARARGRSALCAFKPRAGRYRTQAPSSIAT